MENKPLNEEVNNEELDIITLTDEEGVETKFTIIGQIKHEENTYFALVPHEENNNEQTEYVILKLETDESGEEVLVTVDDDDEFDCVADEFDDQLFSDVDYDA